MAIKGKGRARLTRSRSTLLPSLVRARTPEVVDEDVVLLGLVEPFDASRRHLMTKKIQLIIFSKFQDTRTSKLLSANKVTFKFVTIKVNFSFLLQLLSSQS